MASMGCPQIGRCLIHAPNESVDPLEIEHLALAEALFLQRYGAWYERPAQTTSTETNGNGAAAALAAAAAKEKGTEEGDEGLPGWAWGLIGAGAAGLLAWAIVAYRGRHRHAGPGDPGDGGGAGAPPPADNPGAGGPR
jgi:hypothetical protein